MKQSTKGILSAAAGGAVAIVLIGSVIAACTSSPATTAPWTTPAVPVDEPTTTPAPSFSPADFKVALNTISKQCFGSAGCSVTVAPQFTFAGTAAELQSADCSITYAIAGDESGEVVNTSVLTGESFTRPTSTLSTASSATKVTASVTDVTCQ